MPQKAAVIYSESEKPIHTILVSFGSIWGPKHWILLPHRATKPPLLRKTHRINIFPYNGSERLVYHPTILSHSWLANTNVAKAKQNPFNSQSGEND